MLDKVAMGNLLVDPKTYADDREFHAILSQVRRDDPVMWVEPAGYRPFWLVSKYADVREVESQPALFLNRPRSFLLTAAEEQQLFAQTGEYVATRSVIQVDGAEHKRLRAVTQTWFLPSKLAKLETEVRRIAAGFIAQMAEKAVPYDFVRDIALWYPLRVIMLILGLPPEDAPVILAITQQTMSANDPDTQGRPGLEGILEAQAAVDAYFGKVTRQRRAMPTEDVASVIANARIEDRLLTDFECMSYYLTLATAGHDTTSSTLAGAILALAEHPAQFALLRSQPSLIGTAVEEFLRWTTPIKHFFRTATEDYLLRGKAIRHGDSLMMSYPSANRDSEIFDEPFALRIDRRHNPHLAFGIGPHVCLGMYLARMELRIFLEELLPRLSSITLTGRPEGTQSNFVQGLKKLPVSMPLALPA